MRLCPEEVALLEPVVEERTPLPELSPGNQILAQQTASLSENAAAAHIRATTSLVDMADCAAAVHRKGPTSNIFRAYLQTMG
jgi:hypothetical protein